MGDQLSFELLGDQPYVKHCLHSKRIYAIDHVDFEFDKSFAAPQGTPPEAWGQKNEYLFQRVRDRAPLLLNEDQLDVLVYRQQIKLAVPGKRKPQAVPPDGPADKDATTRQWWCRRYDAVMPMNSQVSLDRFVARAVEEFKDDPEFKALAFVPDGWTVRHWAQTRGHPGWRPLEVMAADYPTRRNYFPKRIEQLLRTSIAWYWSDLRRSRRDAHERIRNVISILNTRAKRKGSSGTVLQIPSYQTFCRRVQASECRETWTAKFDERSANARFDGVEPLPTASKILEVVMIDSTTVDTHLVLDTDLLPLNRPTINFAIDLYSRVVLAIFLTFENPNLHVAMATLKRALLPKLDLIAQFPDKRVTLEPYGTPIMVVVDNEWSQVGKTYQDACADLGINLMFAPIRTPQAKAIVERLVETFNKLVFHKAPGGIPYDTKVLKQLGFDPAKTMILDIEQLQELVVDAVHAYNLSRHDGLGGAAPIVKWRASAALHSIDACLDVDHIDTSAGEVAEASLTCEGVKFDGQVYHNPQKVTHLLERLAPVEPLHSKRHTSIRARVKIKRNPGDLTVIHVWNHRDREYVTLRALKANFLLGLTKTAYKSLEVMAKLANLPFNTEIECAKARATLIRKLEAAHPGRRMDAARKQQRLLLTAQPGEISGSEIRIRKALARHDGMAPVDDELDMHVPIEVRNRAGRAAPVKGCRRGGNAATKKANATRAESKAAAAAEAAEKAAMRASSGPFFPTITAAQRLEPDSSHESGPSRPISAGSKRAELRAKLKEQGWGEGSKYSTKDDCDE